MNLYPNRFTAVLDANVLGGVFRRNILLSLAEAGLFRPRWSIRILNEMEKAISRTTKGNADTRWQREKIERAFPEAIVTGFEVFEDELRLPDPDDNHVLAAAIETAATVIVTDNLKHFRRRCSNRTRLKPVQPMTSLRTPSTFIPLKPSLRSNGCANASTIRRWMWTLSFTRPGHRN